MRLFAIAVFLAAGTILRAAPVAPTPAPSWNLKDVDGNVISSDQFKGKVMIVDFWATWCLPCRKEIPGYIALQKKYGPAGLVVIGVSLDQQNAVAMVKRTIKQLGINYPIVLADDAIAPAFYPDMSAFPTTFVVDRQGLIRDRTVGYVSEPVMEKKLLPYLFPPAPDAPAF